MKRSSTEPGFSFRYFLREPFSIHLVTKDGQHVPSSLTNPLNGRIFSWKSIDHIRISCAIFYSNIKFWYPVICIYINEPSQNSACPPSQWTSLFLLPCSGFRYPLFRYKYPHGLHSNVCVGSVLSLLNPSPQTSEGVSASFRWDL